MRITDAAAKYKCTDRHIRRLIETGACKVGKDGTGVDESSLVTYRENRNISKLNRKELVEDLYNENQDLKTSAVKTAAIKAELLEYELKDIKKQTILIRDMREFFDVYAGDVERLLREMTNALTPKLFELFKVSKEEHVVGQIKKMLSDYSESVRSALAMGAAKLDELSTPAEQDNDDDDE